MRNIERPLYYKYVANSFGTDLYAVVAGAEKCTKEKPAAGYAVRTRYSLYFVISGGGVLELDEKKHRISEGEFFLIPPQIRARIRQDKCRPWNYAWIDFDGRNAQRLAASLFSAESPVYKPANPRLYVDFFAEMLDELYERKTLELIASAYLRRLFSMLLEENASAKADEVPGAEKTVDRALRYIHDNYAEKELSLQSVAEYLFLSPNYFSRIFKQSTGASFSEYLSDLRLQKACALFASDSPVSVSTAAYSTGYRDPLYFSKLFHKKFHVTPTEYIRIYSAQSAAGAKTEKLVPKTTE